MTRKNFTMKAGFQLTVLALATWCAIGTPASAATIWTTAGAGNWSNIANWSAGVPTSIDDVQFDDDDAIGVTTTMDLGPTTTIASYEILLNTNSGLFTTALGTNSLTMTNMTLASSNVGTLFYANLHIAGSAGAKLNVEGTLLMATGRNSRSTLTFDPDVELNIGVDASNRGVLQVIRDTSASFAINRATLTPGSSFNAYLSSLQVGAEGNSAGEGAGPSRAILDLSGVTSGILDVSGNVEIGEGYGAAGQVTVSNDVDVKIGVDASNRGSLRISAGDAKEFDDFASFLNFGTGKLEAYLSELSVGYTTETSFFSGATNDTSFGTLDASDVTNSFIDVDGPVRIGTVIQGVGNGPSTGPATTPLPASAEGTVKLGDFNVSASTLEVGDADNDGGFGRLEMEDTIFSVSTSVSVDGDSDANKGIISTVINGTSSGLYLDSGASLTIGEGLIELIFNGPAPDLLAGPYWGLRWDGEHVGELEALVLSGKLSIDSSGIPFDVGIFSLGGVTYVGVAPVPEPSSLLLLLGLGMLGLTRFARRRSGRRVA